eukprot:GHVL01038759.1.p1 GENE.GHVL01038759.1~~GHVL01038759.1.p1  ORF type:complete len:856 (-),score=131.33 GHVL01038759.1:178-2745(-)
MGTKQSVFHLDKSTLEKVKKIDLYEIGMLRKLFKDLSSRSASKDHIDKQIFMQHFALPGLWGERLFNKFDTNGDQMVDFTEFVVGIALCTRSTKDERKTELVAMLSSLPNISNYFSTSTHQKDMLKKARRPSSCDHISTPHNHNNPIGNDKDLEIDVDSLADQIIEECEFQEGGTIQRAEFKTWLEHHEMLLSIFSDSMHEEVWSQAGKSLHRAMCAAAAASSHMMLPHPEEFGVRDEIKPELISKIERLIRRMPPLDEDDIYNTGSVEEGQFLPIKEPPKNIASLELVDAIAESHTNLHIDSIKNNSALVGKSNMISDSDYTIFPPHSDRLQRNMRCTASPRELTIKSENFKKTSLNEEALVCPSCGCDLSNGPDGKSLTRLHVNATDVFLYVLDTNKQARHVHHCWRCLVDFRYAVQLVSSRVPEKTGFLYKHGKRTHIWTSRFYVLVGNVLYYYIDRAASMPSGMLCLDGCYGELINRPENGRYGLRVCSNQQSINHSLFATTLDERNSWLDCLRIGMKQQTVDCLYNIHERLGDGKFSVVHRASSRRTGQEVAVKIIDKSKISVEERELLRSEMTIMRLLKHHHVITLEEVIDTKEYLYIIMEIVRGGELYDYLSTAPDQRLAEAEVNRITRQLLHTLAYLHNMGIIHRDLKPENILLSDRTSRDIKITDFGLSTLIGPKEVLKQPCGTLAYVAPEVLTLRGYNQQADVWSVGVISFLLLRGRLPFPLSKSIIARAADPTAFRLNMNDSIWAGISQAAKDLIKKMLQHNPAERITVKAALQHHWIKNPTAFISEDGADDQFDSNIFLKSFSNLSFSSFANLDKTPGLPNNGLNPYRALGENFAESEDDWNN